MDLLTILLSSLLSALSPMGLILDETLEGTIRDRFEEVEALQVRIDNAPSHQILAGKVERVRVAGRGLWLPPLIEGGDNDRPSLRIALLEVETDPIDLDLDRLNDGIEALEKPLQAGIRLVLEEEDLDRALSSGTASAEVPTFEMGDYSIIAPQIDFTDENRVQVQVAVRQKGDRESLSVAIESGLQVRQGRYLEFVEPSISVNGEEAAPEILVGILGAAGQWDLDRLTPPGTIVRLLRWHLTPDGLDVAAFVSIDNGQSR
ncbi:DUF2993 domain-containing protein [Oscillatoriales cyanobacterium LEGE 11467]|uniref:DUF2993 domain-containing protein n=1 Tax=Zarconia navalis LEGE 11467 TaxID=1828826 RepID=A0A928VTU3_9CYAN|nr:DUF2993 domain-containing protein [Zarconia navalis]MBE9040152.1 DUF2993 domain-containing protein [Zarconia navalis LEGE 11467]